MANRLGLLLLWAAAASGFQVWSPQVFEIREVRRSVTLPTIPACAESCLHSAVAAETTCAVGDPNCECQFKNAALIDEAADLCVEKACGAEGALRELLFWLLFLQSCLPNPCRRPIRGL